MLFIRVQALQNQFGAHPSRGKRDHGYSVCRKLYRQTKSHANQRIFSQVIIKVVNVFVVVPISCMNNDPAVFPGAVHQRNGVIIGHELRSDSRIEHLAPMLWRQLPEGLTLDGPLVAAPYIVDQDIQPALL
ncbi:hypothetical protein D3C75_984370 [compost metagenome]